MIEGGYYIKAKGIQNSEIAIAPPHIREIWDWLIKEANYKDTKVCLRGQCVRTYKDIINGLSWMVGWRKMGYSKAQCENAMKYLKKHTMIATRKTTRGMVITVLNYDKYQNIKNYKELMSATTKPTREPQSSHTIKKEYKEIKNIYADKNYLLEVPEKDLKELSQAVGVTERDVVLKGKDLFDWCETNGKTKKNYKAFLRVCLRKDHPTPTPPPGINFNSLPIKK